MKRALSVLMALAVAMLTTVAAYAENIGTVDYEKLIRAYNKAQLFSDDSKIKEQELEKMRAEFVKQLREAKTAQGNNPVALDQMEKDLQGKLNTKLNETRDWMASKSKELETEMMHAIESVSQKKGLTMVIAKQTVFVGGTDITNDVLGILNAGAPAKAPAAPAKK